MIFYSCEASHCRNTLKALNKLRQQNCITDVVIKVGTQDIHAHRCVLVAGSEYFSSMLIVQSSTPGSDTIFDLSSVTMDAIAVESVIDLLYTGEISIDIDDLEQFVKVAQYLSITNVQSILCSFMIDTLDHNTCLKYYVVANEYAFRNIEEKASVILKSRFHDCIISKESFSKILPEQLLLLMRQLDIFANCSVEDILQFVTKWVQVGAAVGHANTGCIILDYVLSRVKDGHASFVSSDSEKQHLATVNDFPTSFGTNNFQFEKKLEEVQNLVSCQEIKSDYGLITSLNDEQTQCSGEDQSLRLFEGGKPEENQFQIQTEFDDISKENEFESSKSYIETKKLENDVEVALNMLSANHSSTNESVDSETINAIATELTNNISGKMLQTSDQGVQAVEQYECTICEKKYKRKWGLVHHVNLVHGESSKLQDHQNNDPETICKYCGKHILYKENMKRHLKTHMFFKGTQHTCKICEKSYKFKEYLKQHMRVVHSKEKTHTCFVCKERFCRSSELKLHLSKHTGEVRHVCTVCGVSFKQKRNLITHRKKHDNPKNESSNSNSKEKKAHKMDSDKLLKDTNLVDSAVATQKPCTQSKLDNQEVRNEIKLHNPNRKVKKVPSSKTESCPLDSGKSTEDTEKLGKLYSTVSKLKMSKSDRDICGKVVKPHNLLFEGEKPKENQFQIKTEFDDISKENEFESSKSYIETKKLENDVEVALNMLSANQSSTNESVDSETINAISTELTNNISGKMLQTPDQGMQAVEQYECTICEKKYKRKWGLVHHVNLVHGESSKLQDHQNDDPETICKYCGKHILYKENMKRHLKTHMFLTGTQHTCKICGKSYKFKEYLKQHMRVVHSKEKTHTCFVCKERFCRNSELKLHLSKHTGEVRHVCTVCGVSFKQKRNLITHRKKHDNPKKKPSNSNSKEKKAHKMDSDKLLKDTNLVDSAVATQKPCTQSKLDNQEVRNEVKLHKPNWNVKKVPFLKTESCPLDSGKSSEDTEKLSKLYSTVSKLKMRKSDCDICGKVVKPHNLKRHILTHSSEYTQTCSVCQKTFKTKERLAQHMVSHSERKYPCPVCNKLFLRSNDVTVHMSTHTGEKRFFCHVSSCGKGFFQKCSLISHVRKHTGVKATLPTVQCPVCKRLIVKYNLRRHMVSHSDEKSFMCETCGRQFKSRNALIGHTRLHKAGINKPISCKLCTRRFNWDSSLYKHMITMHGAGKQSHQCSVCGKQFSWKFYLSKHMLLHTDEKRHVCVTCGRGFKDKSALNRHSRMHTGEKNYVCSICAKCFTRQENLNGHMKRYHK